MATALERMGVDVVHTQGNEGVGVRVGIISNGLGSNAVIKGGYDFGLNQALTGLSDNGNFGVASLTDLLSVAPKAHVYDLKITADSLTPIGATVSALDWAVANKMEVLVLGFSGGSAETQLKSAAIDRCASAGIVMFAGVGGSLNHQYGSRFSAAHEHVVAVACLDPNGDGSYFYVEWRVSWGPPYPSRIAYPFRRSVELSVPWFHLRRPPDVWPATAAGVAALLMEDGAKPSEVRNILNLTAEVLPDWNGYPANDLYGNGLIRADLALAYDRTTGLVKEGPVLSGGGPESFFGDFAPKTTTTSTIKRPDCPVLARYPYPRDGQTNFPPKGKVWIRLKSFTDGIDLSAVKISFDCEIYTSDHPDFVWSGNRWEYDIEVPLPQPKGHNEPVIMKVEAKDFAGRSGLAYEGVN